MGIVEPFKHFLRVTAHPQILVLARDNTVLPLCGFGFGVEVVLFPDTQYGTHTVIRSGNEIGWSLHGGSQTIQVCP